MSDEENVSGGSGSDTEKPKPKKKAKKGKKEKSEGPKRPPSAYMFFAQKMRPVLKDENSDANFAQIGRLLGDKWKELSAEEKKPFEALNKEAKAKYIEEGGSEGKKRKKAGSGGAPKRPLSGFMFFSKEYRPILKNENPDAKFPELGKLLGEKWKSLGEDEKNKYSEMNKADKERYADDFEKWSTEHPEEAAALKNKKKKTNNKKPKKKPAKKKKKDEDEDDAEDDGNGEEAVEEAEDNDKDEDED